MSQPARRVLMVSPHFPPDTNAAAHRVRLLAPHLPQFGWEPVVVAVDPDGYEGRLDSGEKVGLVKSNPRLQVQASSVCARKLECLCRNIRCVNLDLRQFLRQGQCDAARTCAHID